MHSQEKTITPLPSTQVLYNPALPLTTSFKVYCVCFLLHCGAKWSTFINVENGTILYVYLETS